jgi:hypothetical protein
MKGYEDDIETISLKVSREKMQTRGRNYTDLKQLLLTVKCTLAIILHLSRNLQMVSKKLLLKKLPYKSWVKLAGT